MCKTIRLPLAAALLALAAPAAVSAALFTPARAGQPQEVGDQVMEKVAYADLDLTRVDDRSALQGRIRQAARRVCAVVTNGGTMVDPDFKRCFADAARDGWRQAAVIVAEASANRAVASAGR